MFACCLALHAEARHQVLSEMRMFVIQPNPNTNKSPYEFRPVFRGSQIPNAFEGYLGTPNIDDDCVRIQNIRKLPMCFTGSVGRNSGTHRHPMNSQCVVKFPNVLILVSRFRWARTLDFLVCQHESQPNCLCPTDSRFVILLTGSTGREPLDFKCST